MNCSVSIIIPLFNMENEVEKCIKSILNQSYKDIEIIIVDDGSTDNSLNICKRIARVDKRVMVYHKENEGSGPARNYGIERAKGKYIYFPDADDFIEINAIEKLVSSINKDKYDLIVFGYKEINSLGKIKKIKKYPSFSDNCDNIRNDYNNYFGINAKYNIQGAPWNKFFKLDIIKNNKIRYPMLRRHQDEVFISNYMSYIKNKVCFIEDILYTHYTNDLKAEWKKYPKDYFNSVIGLYNSRKSTILKWNTSNETIRKKINVEYVCNVIKALELTFSPKNNFTKKQRLNEIKAIINKSKIKEICKVNLLNKYQRIIVKTIMKNRMYLLYVIFKLKITIESTKLYVYLRNK